MRVRVTIVAKEKQQTLLFLRKYLCPALVTQHPMRKRRIVLPWVACMSLPYCSTLSKKQHVFLKKKKII